MAGGQLLAAPAPTASHRTRLIATGFRTDGVGVTSFKIALVVGEMDTFQTQVRIMKSLLHQDIGKLLNGRSIYHGNNLSWFRNVFTGGGLLFQLKRNWALYLQARLISISDIMRGGLVQNWYLINLAQRFHFCRIHKGKVAVVCLSFIPFCPRVNNSRSLETDFH
jgi:hypothetical protein